MEFAAQSDRAVLTLNRREFIGLHARLRRHAGIVVCTQDPEAQRQAAAIDSAVRGIASLQGSLIRINRPA